jgi:hypothetical protein
MPDIYLPLDATGRAVTNKVQEEPHVLVNRPVRIAVPEYGAFYAESLVVTDTASGKVLTKKQYRADEMLKEATAQYGKRICTVVLITDESVGNDITITYQALGNWYNYSQAKLNAELAALVGEEDGVRWEDIIDKPTEFSPGHHLHHISELYGTEYWEAALGRITEAANTKEQPVRDRIVAAISNKTQAALDNINQGTGTALTAHKNDSNPHPQYAKATDLGQSLSLVRTPRTVTPANNATAVVLETALQASPYYSLFGAAQRAAQFHLAFNADFSDIQLLVTKNGAAESFLPDALLQGSKTYYWRVRYQDTDNNWSDWSTASKFTTVPPYPAQGTVLSTYCAGIVKWGVIADGRNGSTEKVLDAKSTDCGYIAPIAAGTFLRKYCKQLDQWYVYADGNYGEYETLHQANSTECGYVPPPVAGIELRRYCVGTTLHVVYTNGSGGENDVIKELNSTECGYVAPPAAGTILSSRCSGFTRYNTVADGMGGSSEVLAETNSTYCGYVAPTYPAAGTVIGYVCEGYDKYNKIANGSGGFTTVLAERNSLVCGYSYPPAGQFIREYCKGVDLWRVYHDGSGGTYESVYQLNSTTCGYVPPYVLKPTWVTPANSQITNRDGTTQFHLSEFLISTGSGANDGTEWIVVDSNGTTVHTGSHISIERLPTVPSNKLLNHQSYAIYARYRGLNMGWSNWTDALPFQTNWQDSPAYGTLLNTFCQGIALWSNRSDGNYGSYQQLEDARSTECGYVPPFAAGFDQIPRSISAYRSNTSASARLAFSNNGTWAVTIFGSGTLSQNGRYLPGTSDGYEVLINNDLYQESDGGFDEVIVSLPQNSWQSLANGLSLYVADSGDPSESAYGVIAKYTLTFRHSSDPGYTKALTIHFDVDGACFAVGTMLKTPTGDRAVESFLSGDLVTSFSEPTMIDSAEANWETWTTRSLAECVMNEVSMVASARQFTQDRSIKINGMHSTLSHRHLVYDGHVFQWKRAEHVALTDCFVTDDLELIAITSIEQVTEPTTFVALNVEDIDTLQVKVGTKYILSHNLS